MMKNSSILRISLRKLRTVVRRSAPPGRYRRRRPQGARGSSVSRCAASSFRYAVPWKVAGDGDCDELGGGHVQMAIGIVANVCDDNVVLVRRLRDTAADVDATSPPTAITVIP